MSNFAKIRTNIKLLKATEKGNVATLKKALADGADVNARSKMGSTALMVAARYGYPDCLKSLIDAGANLNAKNVTGDTALIFAINGRHQECLIALAEAGADITGIKSLCLNHPEIYLRIKSAEEQRKLRSTTSSKIDINKDDGIGL